MNNPGLGTGPEFTHKSLRTQDISWGWHRIPRAGTEPATTKLQIQNLELETWNAREARLTGIIHRFS